MGDISSRNFGIVVAYILPGLLGLLACSPYNATVRAWLNTADSTGPTVAGFLYFGLVSLGIGMAASAVRWATIDRIHARFNVTRPRWDDSRLATNLDAYRFLIDIHYRYYQFYANSLVVLPAAYLSHRLESQQPILTLLTIDFFAIALCCVLFFASRDALDNYHRRVSLLLGTTPEFPMTNGGHHDHAAGTTPTQSPHLPKTKPTTTKVAELSKGDAPKTVPPPDAPTR